MDDKVISIVPAGGYYLCETIDSEEFRTSRIAIPVRHAPAVSPLTVAKIVKTWVPDGNADHDPEYAVGALVIHRAREAGSSFRLHMSSEKSYLFVQHDLIVGTLEDNSEE
jgi:hypothetical protein